MEHLDRVAISIANTSKGHLRSPVMHRRHVVWRLSIAFVCVVWGLVYAAWTQL